MGSPDENAAESNAHHPSKNDDQLPADEVNASRSAQRGYARHRRSHLLPWAVWLAAVACLLAIIPIRATAHASDFAKANVLTLIMVALAWLLLAIGLTLAQFPRRVWLSMLISPLIALGLFLIVFRFERVDGELRPKFRSRWTSESSLPPPPSASQAPPRIAAELLEPRSSDFAQFLGPDRDARLPKTQLNPDWSSQPPNIAWQHSIGDGWSSFAVQGDVAVTMEQRDDQEWVSAYSVVDGQLLWVYAMPGRHANVMGGTGPRSTPTIEGDHVFACSAVSRCVCLQLLDGSEVWARELLELSGTSQAEFEAEVAWGRAASPLIVDRKVIVPLGGVGPRANTLIALQQDSGQEVWRSGDDQISYSSPVLAQLRGIRQILLTSESKLAAYDPESGAELWATPWPGSSSNNASVSQPVVIDDSRVLLTKGYGEGSQMLRIDFEENEGWSFDTLWKNKTGLRTKFTTTVVHDGFAYGLSDGILECLELTTGQRQWKAGRYRQGQLLLVGKHLLITSESGEAVLVEASPAEFNELARLPVIGDVSWNTAALSGNRLLMRNSDEAACVLLPLVE